MRRVVATLIALSACVLSAAPKSDAADPPPKRARPPKWPAEVLDVFFTDAREQLEGERPDYAARRTSGPIGTLSSAQDSTTPTAAKFAWSKLIDADTIETEVKRLAQAVAGVVTTPGEFKGGTYQECRRHFSTLAALFAVAAEYDSDVRWHDAAAGLRDSFAQAGFNCKVGTDQTYREAVARKQDLTDLIAGSRPQLPRADVDVEWGRVADRPPLMQRMELAHQGRLTKWLANEHEFAQHRDDVRHEAQLVAVIAEVITREGYEYWDDATYADYADELRQAAAEVAAAAESENFQGARAAGARMTKACTDCHDGYRG